MKRIRLTESDLHTIVTESVKRILEGRMENKKLIDYRKLSYFTSGRQPDCTVVVDAIVEGRKVASKYIELNMFNDVNEVAEAILDARDALMERYGEEAEYKFLVVNEDGEVMTELN